MRTKNIYEPYTVVTDAESVLRLAESKKRRWFLFSFYRIYPVLLFVLVAVAFAMAGEYFPALLGDVFLFAIFVICILLLTRKVLYEVVITPRRIIVTYSSLLGHVEQEMETSDASRIRYRHSGGKGGGMFYDVVMNDGSKYRILSIPVWYMDTKNHKEISRRLTEITGLTVEEV